MNVRYRMLAFAIVAAFLSLSFSGCIGGPFGAGKAALAASLDANPISGEAPLKVTFAISGSSASGLKEWKITYGDEISDGASVSGGSFSVTKTHTYEKTGTYTAKLVVADAAGASDVKIKKISVSGGSSAGPSGGNGEAPNGEAPAPETLVYQPSKQVLEKIDLQGKTRIVLTETGYECLPILAPVFKNFGINAGIGWDNGDGVSIDVGDKSRFSSEVALTFWEGNASNVIVVDSYENAILAGPLASVLNAPILYCGTTTNEALWRIGATKSNEIIAVGNTPYSSAVQASLQSQEAVWDYTISAARQKGINLNYLAVVNPDDVEGLQSYFPQSAPYTAHLSSFGPMFAAYHNGIVVCCSATGNATGNKAPSPEAIDTSIEKVAAKLRDAGMAPKFLLMLGDSVSLPFAYYNMHVETITGGIGYAPTDNVYASLAGKPSEGYDSETVPAEASAVDLANGRLVAKDLAGLTRYADRIFNYANYLTTTVAPVAPAPAIVPTEWNNNALAYSSTAAEFGTPEELQAYAILLKDGGFNTQEASAAGHTSGGLVGGLSLVSGTLLSELFTMSNLIVAGADHGCPQGNAVMSNQLKPMPPNVNFQVSCLTGDIDTYHPDEAWNHVSKSDSFVYAMLDNGVAALIAATRSTTGVLTGSYPAAGVTMGTSGDLAYYFMDNLITKDCTVGEALQTAKSNVNNDLIRFEYHVYGDPAFNPYEPCNEGS